MVTVRNITVGSSSRNQLSLVLENRGFYHIFIHSLPNRVHTSTYIFSDPTILQV